MFAHTSIHKLVARRLKFFFPPNRINEFPFVVPSQTSQHGAIIDCRSSPCSELDFAVSDYFLYLFSLMLSVNLVEMATGEAPATEIVENQDFGFEPGVWCEKCNKRLVELKRQTLKLILPELHNVIQLEGSLHRVGIPLQNICYFSFCFSQMLHRIEHDKSSIARLQQKMFHELKL